MARMNLKDVYDFGVRLVDKVYLQTTNDKIIAKRLITTDLTKRTSVYEDIIRKSQVLFNVQVYRNTSCIHEGIYIVGRENFVDAYKKWIEMVINRIEKDTWDYGNPIRSKAHGNTLYSKYASKKSQQVLGKVFDLIRYKDIILNPGRIGKCLSDYLATQSYCKQLSVLKNKTKYNGELRYTAGNPGKS